MKENSHILHCYDNLVAMATANNYFSLVVYSLLLKIYNEITQSILGNTKPDFFSYGLSLRGPCVNVRASYL